MFRILALTSAFSIWLALPQGTNYGPGAAAAASKPSTSASQAGKFTISRETTYITGPLNEDGTINYVQAINDIYSKGVTPENNAAILLFKAFGPKFADEKIRPQLLKSLGLSDLPEKGDYFRDIPENSDFQDRLFKANTNPSDPDNYPTLLKKWKLYKELDEQLSRAMTRPADPVTEPLVIQWLKENTHPLEIFITASKLDKYYYPVISTKLPPTAWDSNIILFLSSPKKNYACKALIARALLRAKNSDIKGAQEDLLAVHRIARLMCNGIGVMDCMIGPHLNSLTCRVEQYIAINGLLNSQQILGLLKQIRDLPSYPSMADRIQKLERFYALDAVMDIMRQGVEGFVRRFEVQTMPSVPLPDINLDYDEFARAQNHDIDELFRCTSLQTFAQRKEAFSKLEESVSQEIKDIVSQIKVDDLQEIPKLHRRRIALLISKVGLKDKKTFTRKFSELINRPMDDTFTWCNFLTLTDIARTKQSLTEVTLAMAAYKEDNGGWPENLEKLVPKYLPALPNDPFVDKPLKYRRNDKGWILYSVGENMVDDGGKRSDGPAGKEDDICVEGK